MVGIIDTSVKGVKYDVEKLVHHPNYDWYLLQHDIGLLKTKTEIVENDYVKRVPLGTDYAETGIAVVAGWGESEGVEFPNLLSFVNVTLMSNSACKKKLQPNQNHVGCVHDYTLCASGGEGYGTCDGEKAFEEINKI